MACKTSYFIFESSFFLLSVTSQHCYANVCLLITINERKSRDKTKKKKHFHLPNHHCLSQKKGKKREIAKKKKDVWILFITNSISFVLSILTFFILHISYGVFSCMWTVRHTWIFSVSNSLIDNVVGIILPVTSQHSPDCKRLRKTHWHLNMKERLQLWAMQSNDTGFIVVVLYLADNKNIVQWILKLSEELLHACC